MDTGTHFRAIWRRRWLVLGAAVAAALLVLAVRSAQEQTFSARADLFLVPGESTTSAANEIERLTVYYGELVRDPRIVADLIRRSELPIDPADVSSLVDVSSSAKGQLSVLADQPTAERAAVLADATADALSAGAVLDQAEAQRREIAPLQAELDRLEAELFAMDPDDSDRGALEQRRERTDQARVEQLANRRARLDVVRRAQAENAISNPQPLRDALLAFVLVLIVAGELAALAAVRRRGVEGGDPIATVETWVDVPVFRLGSSRHGPDESGAALRFLRADDAERPLYVAPLAPLPSTGPGVEQLLDTLAAMGARIMWVDLRQPSETEAPPMLARGAEVLRPQRKELERLAERRPVPTLITADAWESPELLRLGELLPGTCVLLLDAHVAREPEVTEAIRVLVYADLAPQAVLVADGRAPRRSRRPLRLRRATKTGRPERTRPVAA